MKRALWIFGLTFVVGSALVSAHEVPGHLVLNGDVTATVETPDGEQTLTGRMNAYLILREGSMDDGVRVEALNVAFFGVDQRAMTGRAVRGKPTGVVGFATTGDGNERQRLRYDPRRRALVGTVSGHLDMPQFYEMTELRINPEDDVVEIPTIPAKLSVQIGVEELGEISEGREKPVETRLHAEMTMSVEPTGDLAARAFDLRARGPYVKAQLVWWPFIEIGRRLCIQPVRILSFTGGFPFPFFSVSGDGLAFGRPGNDTQWAKADVVFTYRDWITLFQPQFSTFSRSRQLAVSGERGRLYRGLLRGPLFAPDAVRRRRDVRSGPRIVEGDLERRECGLRCGLDPFGPRVGPRTRSAASDRVQHQQHQHADVSQRIQQRQSPTEQSGEQEQLEQPATHLHHQDPVAGSGLQQLGRLRTLSVAWCGLRRCSPAAGDPHRRSNLQLRQLPAALQSIFPS